MTATDAANHADNDLPNGWVRVTLGEVCNTSSGGTPSRKIASYFSGNIPWVKSGELNYNVIEDTEEKISEDALANSSAKIIPKGTLLIALYGATVGRMATLGIAAATNQAVCAIENSESIEREYLYHYLFFSKESLLEQRVGGAQPNISQTILNALPFPLPPLPEQHRIVAKIERLFARLARAEAALAAAEAGLERYRQSVLKTAFSATDAEGKMKDGWKWVKLGEVAKTSSGGTPSRKITSYFSGNIPWVKSGELNYNTIFDTEEKITKEALENSSAKIFTKGTLLIALYGATVGRLAYLGIDAATNQAVCAISPNDSLKKEFLFHFLDFSNSKLLEQRVGGAQPNISQTILNELNMPLPPIEIQEQIVSQITTALTRASALHAAIAQARAECARLRQSILREAFAGRLVPQAAGDEPAGVLLERIKKERGKARL